jgi:hypothetical protein
MNKNSKEWETKNRSKRRAYEKKYRSQGKTAGQKLRVAFLAMYGDKCECCGEKERAFLCLDHKKGVSRRVTG